MPPRPPPLKPAPHPTISPLRRSSISGDRLVSRCGAIVLCSFVAGHPRLGDALTRTSQLIALDAGAGHARTASRWYRLGLALPQREAGTEHDPWFLCPPDPGLMPFEDLDALSRLLAVYRTRVIKVHTEAQAEQGRRRH